MQNRGPALQAREGIEVQELTHFELLTKLAEQGWCCEVAPKRIKRRELAYRLGERKVFWLREGDLNVVHMYMVALLQADVHKLSVLPFQTSKYYKSLLTGIEYIPQRQKKKLDFVMEPERRGPEPSGGAEKSSKTDDVGMVADEVDAAAAAAAEPLAAAPIEEEDDNDSNQDALDDQTEQCSDSDLEVEELGPLGLEVVEDEARDGDFDAGIDVLPPVPEHGLSGPLYAEGGSAGSGDPAPAAAAGPPRAKVAAKAKAAMPETGPAAMRGEDAESFWWRDAFRFTKTFNRKGEWIGYQAACFYHDADGVACRRTRSLLKWGGADQCLRLLKTWCVVGASGIRGTADFDDHFEMPNEDPMDDAALEAWELPPIDPFGPEAFRSGGSKYRSKRGFVDLTS